MAIFEILHSYAMNLGIFLNINDEWLFVLIFWSCHNIVYYTWAWPCAFAYRRNWWSYWKV